MTAVTLARAAQADVRAAARHYEQQVSGLGLEFIAELDRSLILLSGNPEIGTMSSRGARKLLVQRFPHLVIYRVEPRRILVLAVGHQRRHPEFWLHRT